MLTPGTLNAKRFPERVRQPATAEPDSLEAFGIPAAVRANWGGSIATLNGLQLMAINHYGALDGENFVVTAPTSSGKTMIGELAALQKAHARQRGYIPAPDAGACQDKYDQFTRLHSPAGSRTIDPTGEHSDQLPELLRGQFARR